MEAHSSLFEKVISLRSVKYNVMDLALYFSIPCIMSDINSLTDH